MTRQIVIVEDDPKIGALMCEYLEANDYAPHHFADGAAMLEGIGAITPSPSAIILDVMLPRLNGFYLCEKLRQRTEAPILFVSARTEEADKLRGLASGADDYVCKPFSMRELVARVDAIVRRAEGRLLADPERQPFLIDEHGLRIAWGGRWLALSRSEYRILAAMMRAPNRAFSRNELLDLCADDFRDVSDRAIDSHVKNIRRKIAETGGGARPIVSVYGVGYKFDPEQAGA